MLARLLASQARRVDEAMRQVYDVNMDKKASNCGAAGYMSTADLHVLSTAFGWSAVAQTLNDKPWLLRPRPAWIPHLPSWCAALNKSKSLHPIGLAHNGTDHWDPAQVASASWCELRDIREPPPGPPSSTRPRVHRLRGAGRARGAATGHTGAVAGGRVHGGARCAQSTGLLPLWPRKPPPCACPRLLIGDPAVLIGACLP